MSYTFYPSHLWELNQCNNCGMVRTSISLNTKPQKSRTVYSKNEFKTIDVKAGECFKKQ